MAMMVTISKARKENTLKTEKNLFHFIKFVRVSCASERSEVYLSILSLLVCKIRDFDLLSVSKPVLLKFRFFVLIAFDWFEMFWMVIKSERPEIPAILHDIKQD